MHRTCLIHRVHLGFNRSPSARNTFNGMWTITSSRRRSAWTVDLTTSLPWCHYKTTHKSAKFEPLKHLCLLFRTGVYERIFINTYSIESRLYRTGKYTVYRRVCASFSPESLQAGTVKGLRAVVPGPLFSACATNTVTTWLLLSCSKTNWAFAWQQVHGKTQLDLGTQQPKRKKNERKKERKKERRRRRRRRRGSNKKGNNSESRRIEILFYFYFIFCFVFCSSSGNLSYIHGAN